MKKYSDINQNQAKEYFQSLDAVLNDLFNTMDNNLNIFLSEINIENIKTSLLPPEEADKKWIELEVIFAQKEEKNKDIFFKKSNICEKIFNNLVFEANIGRPIYKFENILKMFDILSNKDYDLRDLPFVLQRKSEIFNEVEKLKSLIENSKIKNLNFTIQGFPITLCGVNLTGSTEEDFIIKRAVRCIDLAINEIKNKGLKKALEKHFILGRKINIFFEPAKDSFFSGWYTEGSGDISILLEDLMSHDPVYNFCHEFGHAYYFNDISSVGREEWVKDISKTRIEEEDLKDFLNLFKEFLISKLNNINLNANTILLYNPPRDKEDFKDKIKLIPGEIKQRKFNSLLNFIKIKIGFKNTNNIEEAQKSTESSLIKLEDFLSKKIKTHSFALEEDLTNYAMTMPEETFAEAFAIYITKGPQGVPPKTRAKLIQMCSSPGMSLKNANKRIKIFKLLLNSN